MTRLFDMAHNENGSTVSRCCTLVVLHAFIEKFKNGKDDNDSEKGGDDDDDIIIKNNSESDEEKTNSSADTVIIECLVLHIQPIQKALADQPDEMRISFGETFRPLGMLRLRLIELLTQIIKVNQPQIMGEVFKSMIVGSLMDLVVVHPWNNFLQLNT